MIVKPKSQEREAWRYTGQPAYVWPAWVRACVHPQAHCGALCLTRKSGKQWLNPGEWLVRNLDGDPEWLTHDRMCREYDEVKA